MKQKRYKEGYFIGLGMAFGIALGMPIGLAIGNIALVPALGLPLGLAIGAAMEKKKNPNPILLTKEEKEKRSKVLKIALGVGSVLLLSALVVFFLLRR